MKEIKLTKGKVALVDDEDFDLLNRHKWSCQVGTSYAGRREKNKIIYMHRQIVIPRKGLVVDHINGDGLDNRRSNLRAISHKENIRAMRWNRRNKSGYMGVSWHKAAKKWEACVTRNCKKVYLGVFANKKDAATARLNYEKN